MKQIASLPTVILVLLSAAAASGDAPVRPGDRIAIIGNTFADQLRIHGYLESLLLHHFRESPISVRNLGWGGDTLTNRDRPTNFASEESKLQAHKTDVIIACFGMGESFDGVQNIPAYKNSLTKLINLHTGKSYNGESRARVILVSPIACEDLGKLTPNHSKRSQELAAYTKAMREVASSEDVPFIDLFTASEKMMQDSSLPNLTNNGIHLNRFGYWATSQPFFRQLTGEPGKDRQPWRLMIDAKAKVVKSRGVEVAKPIQKDLDLNFGVIEKSGPSLPPPTSERLPDSINAKRDTLIVKNLEPGNYILTIDDKPVATANAQAWAKGLPVDNSPAHQTAETFRAAVNDKNLQFTYSWKALNQVHIVGERKSSPSGRALPNEVIKFNELANQRDQDLRGGIELKTRQWRLSRVKD